jgi:hypothetical protein
LKTDANQALGIIETSGRVPLIEAVDSAVKAAAVTLKSAYFVGGGLNTVTLAGDVGAMRAALDAAQAAIDRMGAPGRTHLIPRLAEAARPLVMDQTSGRGPPRGNAGAGPAKPPAPPPDPAGPPALAEVPAEPPGGEAASGALFPDETAGPPPPAAPSGAETGGGPPGKKARNRNTKPRT